MSPQEMRGKANECEHMAQLRIESGAQKMYADLAKAWRELALEAGKYPTEP
jgi:hypothetical protein